MNEPIRKSPTMARVKKIFRRRSGVLKILPNALNTTSPCSCPVARGFELTCWSAPEKKSEGFSLGHQHYLLCD
jgi:hypothetical protein